MIRWPLWEEASTKAHSTAAKSNAVYVDDTINAIIVAHVARTRQRSTDPLAAVPTLRRSWSSFIDIPLSRSAIENDQVCR